MGMSIKTISQLANGQPHTIRFIGSSDWTEVARVVRDQVTGNYLTEYTTGGYGTKSGDTEVEVQTPPEVADSESQALYFINTALLVMVEVAGPHDTIHVPITKKTAREYIADFTDNGMIVTLDAAECRIQLP